MSLWRSSSRPWSATKASLSSSRRSLILGVRFERVSRSSLRKGEWNSSTLLHQQEADLELEDWVASSSLDKNSPAISFASLTNGMDESGPGGGGY